MNFGRRNLLSAMFGAGLALSLLSAPTVAGAAPAKKPVVEAQMVFASQGNPAHVDPKLRVTEAERRKHPAFANVNRFFVLGNMSKELGPKPEEARLDVGDVRLLVTRVGEPEGGRVPLEVRILHKNKQRLATKVRATSGSHLFIVLPYARGKEPGRLIFALKTH